PLPFSLPALLTFLPPASPPLALHPSPPRRSSDLPHHHASRARRRAGSLRPLDPVAKPAKPAVRAAPAARSDVPAALRPAGAGLTLTSFARARWNSPTDPPTPPTSTTSADDTTDSKPTASYQHETPPAKTRTCEQALRFQQSGLDGSSSGVNNPM